MKSLISVGIWIVILTLLVVFGMGFSIPETHTATVSTTVAAPVDSVWAALTDPAAYPEWRPDVSDVTVLPDVAGRPSWREVAAGQPLTLEVTQWTPPTRMVTRIVDEDLPFGGTWIYELAPAPGGTRVVLTENGEIYSPLYRFVAQFFLGYEGTMNDYLDALTARFGAVGGGGTPEDARGGP